MALVASSSLVGTSSSWVQWMCDLWVQYIFFIIMCFGC
jgi:hypothetical protein